MFENSDIFNDDFPSKQAFALAREKINISFFRDLFLFSKKLSYQGDYRIKKWKGYRLVAVDGTAFRVPDSEENRKFIGVHENQHGGVAACKILAFHDVLNKIFVKIIPHPRAVAELVALHLNFDSTSSDSVTIYDRHYCDSLLLDRHLKAGKPCVVRMKTSGVKVVKKFLESGKKDDLVEFQIGERSYYSARDKYGLKNNHARFSKFRMRLIRVELKTGEIEVLATNLFDKNKFPHECFKNLYAKRWGVETAFDEIKNQMKMAMFSGYKSHTVVQDIWSVFIFYNIRGIFIKHAQKLLDKRKKSNLINRNFAVSVLKKFWSKIMLGDRIGKLLKKMVNWIKNNHYRIRPRPPSKRKRKQMRANERHMTEKNYKPAF